MTSSQFGAALSPWAPYRSNHSSIACLNTSWFSFFSTTFWTGRLSSARHRHFLPPKGATQPLPPLGQSPSAGSDLLSSFPVRLLSRDVLLSIAYPLPQSSFYFSHWKSAEQIPEGAQTGKQAMAEGPKGGNFPPCPFPEGAASRERVASSPWGYSRRWRKRGKIAKSLDPLGLTDWLR